MTRWQYEITTCTVDDVLGSRDRLGLTAGNRSADIFFCNSKGHCFFDEMPNPEVAALMSLFNVRGGEGWELVQFVYHKGDMVCFWKRRLEQDQAMPIPPHAPGT